MLVMDCHILPHLKLSGQFRQRQGWDHNGRTLDGHLLMIPRQGDCTLTVGEETCHLTVGDAMVIPAGQYYRPRTEEGCEYYYFHFADAPASSEEEDRRKITLPFYISGGEEERGEILRLAQRICDLGGDDARQGSTLLAEVCLTELLVLLSSIGGKDRQRTVRSSALLEKAALYIRRHVTERITLGELSAHFGVSEQYIMRLFRRHLGTTPTAYIHRIKLENACWLLVHSTMNVTEISDYLGFSGSHYFIRLFKKYYGVTPLQYAKGMTGRGSRGSEEHSS